MKLIHMSDIHGDIETLGRASRLIGKVSDAEVVAITGDLAGRVLEGKEREKYVALLNKFRPLRDQLYHATQGKVNSVRETTKAIIDGRFSFSNEIPSEVVANEKRNANDYLELEAKTKDGLRNQYESIRQVLEAMPQTKVLVPGNWDCHCMDDSLAQFNLHNRANKNFKVNGVHFIGYGGSEDCPIEMPEEWIIPFNDGEAYRHLTKESEKDDATIALVHCPVAGYAGNDSSGSYALRAFMNLRHPDLILQGHTHKTLMTKDKETGTIISNPGNIGRYANHEFGTLAEIDYNDETGIVTPLYLWKITGEPDARRIDLKEDS